MTIAAPLCVLKLCGGAVTAASSPTYLLAEGVPVARIMGHNKVDPATLTPGVRLLPDATLVYPVA
jgi:hypothetical protein